MKTETKEARIFLEMWNPEIDKMEWMPFGVEDVDFLMEKEIIDTDSLGYAMTDSAAFEMALLKMTEMNRAFTYSELVEIYLSMTDEDIHIEA